MNQQLINDNTIQFSKLGRQCESITTQFETLK
jgi:hypothetical protein